MDEIRRRLAACRISNPSRPGDRRAAVVIPILGTPARLVGILRRDVGPHGGQFGLPGGAIEPGDAGPLEAALREMHEEIGVSEGVEVLGRLGEYNTYVSRFRVDVWVAALREPDRWRPDPSEVDAVLEIPMERLVALQQELPTVDDTWELPIGAGYELDPRPFVRAGEVPPRGTGHVLETDGTPRDVPFIWGLTARILYDFIRRAWTP